MRRAMTLFFSFVLVCTFALPNSYDAADNFLSLKKQVVSHFFNYFFPNDKLEVNEEVHESFRAVNKRNSQPINTSEMNPDILLNSEEIHTSNENSSAIDPFLPILHDIEVHDNLIWSIEFNDEIDPNSITNKTLYIVNNDGEIVPTLIIHDSMRTINILPPVDKYEIGESYFLYLTNEIESSTGLTMPEQYVLKFSVQDNHLHQLEQPQSMKLSFSFETGYEGINHEVHPSFHYDDTLLKQMNDEMNEMPLGDDVLMRLMKKFDEIEEEWL